MSAAEPAHPLAHLPRGHHGAPGEGVTIAFPRRELVQVMARRGAVPDGAALGLALPGPGGSAVAGGLTAAWIQPGGWMISAPWAGEGALLARCAPLAAWAAVTDQSHGRTVIAVSGPAWREAMERLCRVDLHPRVFAPGRVIGTPLAHVQASLLATGEGVEITCFSTLAESLAEALIEAAAPHGLHLAG